VKWYESADAIVFGSPALVCLLCFIARPEWRMGAVAAIFWVLLVGGLYIRYRREKRK